MRIILAAVFFLALILHVAAQNAALLPSISEARAKSDLEVDKKAAGWAESLALNDPAKNARLAAVISSHLRAIRDWHNTHPPSTVPAGINPVTGLTLSELDRQVIANSTQPKSYHADLMNGLRLELSEAQVEAVLDKYTVGKVAFTMKGYQAIVPDLTAAEAATILAYLKEARERSIDFKNMNQISVIFEIYKTKSEQFLISNGRNWRALYKSYTDSLKAKKSADAAAKAAATPR
jgi:hypothetical protein